MDINKIKAKFSVFQKSPTGTNANYKKIWKPTAKHVIRLLPNKFDPTNPFTEIKLHYNINGKVFISPSTFGRPDPIIEFSEELKKSPDKKQRYQGFQLEPKPKYYVAVLVRGEEDKGIQYWGFSPKTLTSIISLMEESDYTEIADLEKGRDITVTFQSVAETKTKYTGLIIQPKGSVSPAFKADQKNIMDTQIEIKDLFNEPSYETIAKDLAEHFRPTDNEVDTDTEADHAGTSTEDDKPPFSAAPAPTSNKSPSALKSKENKKSDLAEFDELFEK